MIRYSSLFTNAFTQWIHIVELCLFFTSSRRHNGVDTSMTLHAAKWTALGGERSSCVINTIPLDHVL